MRQKKLVPFEKKKNEKIESGGMKPKTNAELGKNSKGQNRGKLGNVEKHPKNGG